MDDGLRLAFLLMAGVLPLMALRDRLSRRMFRLLAAAYAIVAVAAVVALLTVGTPRPPIPDDVPLVRT